jgi:hypothetical protein
MPSNSYWSLLVLALAASTVSPVRCAKTQYVVFILGTKSPSLPDVSNSSGRQIEDRGDTSGAPSRHRTRGPGVYLGLGLAGALLAVALVTTFYHGGGGQQPSATRPVQHLRLLHLNRIIRPELLLGGKNAILALLWIPPVSRTQTYI